MYSTKDQSKRSPLDTYCIVIIQTHIRTGTKHEFSDVSTYLNYVLLGGRFWWFDLGLFNKPLYFAERFKMSILLSFFFLQGEVPRVFSILVLAFSLNQGFVYCQPNFGIGINHLLNNKHGSETPELAMSPQIALGPFGFF